MNGTNKTIQVVTRFLEKILGGSLEELGNIGQDWIKYYRYKNLLLIQDKIEAIMKKRKGDGKVNPIPLRLAIPLLQSASIEDDDSIQELWARLIANATDPDKNIDLHPAFIEIINQLSPDEAKILIKFEEIAEFSVILSAEVKIDNKKKEVGIIGNGLYDSLKNEYFFMCTHLTLKASENVMLYIDNLLRLQIIEFTNILEPIDKYPRVGIPVLTGTDYDKLEVMRKEHLQFTEFGKKFLNACKK